MASPEHIASLLFRYLRKELTVSEVNELQAWRHESPEQEQLFLKLTNEEALPGLLKEFYDRREMVWNKIVEQAPELASQRAPRFWGKWTTAAAILIVAVGTTYWLMQHFAERSDKDTESITIVESDIPPGTNKATLTLGDGTQMLLGKAKINIPIQGMSTAQQEDSGLLVYAATNPESPKMVHNTLSTPRGGQYSVTLPDGTRVWLNAASSLTYPVQFNGVERKVGLSGEAYFEVVKNPRLPFKVMINHKAEVTVLGTHFNIQSYTDESIIATTVLEGSVRFQSLVLKSGEQGQLQKNGLLGIDKNVEVENVVAWKNGMIQFSNTDVPTIMRNIERWYDVDVHYAGKIPTKRLTGGITRGVPLSDILKVLEMYNIHTTLKNNRITVQP